MCIFEVLFQKFFGEKAPFVPERQLLTRFSDVDNEIAVREMVLVLQNLEGRQRESCKIRTRNFEAERCANEEISGFVSLTDGVSLAA